MSRPVQAADRDAEAVALLPVVWHSLSTRGYAHLDGLPEGFDHLGLLRRLGAVLPQYDGLPVWDLVAEPDMDDVYHSRNTRALVPHTEGYELAGTPPRYVALWCVRPAEGPGGETTLADGRALLDGFAAADLALMRRAGYVWRSSEGLARRGVALQARHPILSDHNGSVVLRYSGNNVFPAATHGPVERDLLSRYRRAGDELFARAHTAVALARGDLLVWDNWRMLHSRNAFRDRRRHLKRVLLGT
ncbi:TauD/TfdA family dioxygenase [Actinocorallia sp. A-T 12471]|uniref:TauD/TfdA family dioxygenase n=1 Tax=Actinocorallia sp. A-T 12471 TaxID=3089813 RepID=UPI0029CD05D5|nr:TauD/TfdA family dioxygenase [Actinocorallia sp. A-T 12471]MDX6742363.1 TauD/TfdA family dioxygenase [Actinocorallia sp. A-T 12471]